MNALRNCHVPFRVSSLSPRLPTGSCACVGKCVDARVGANRSLMQPPKVGGWLAHNPSRGREKQGVT